MDRTSLLADQLDWHWTGHLRPELEGLADAEYLWEPAPGGWSVRPRGEPSADAPAGTVQVGEDRFAIDFALPEPSPPPVTTIAWRLAHVIVGAFGNRVAGHFGGPELRDLHRATGA